MNSVAARRPGASFSTRAFALVLAGLATGIPLFLLLLGLSIKTAQAIRESRMMVDLIEIPPPPPPVETPMPVQARPAERAAAPAAVESRPATPVEQSLTPLPAPPAPPSAEISGTGTGITPGTGTGGSGTGGDGTGPGGGSLVKVPMRTEASWIYKPDTRDLEPYNPRVARNEYVTGRVLLNCRVRRTNKVFDCRITAERPRGYGFGAAALEASVLFRLRPPMIDGEIDERRRVEIPVTFNNRR